MFKIENKKLQRFLEEAKKFQIRETEHDDEILNLGDIDIESLIEHEQTNEVYLFLETESKEFVAQMAAIMYVGRDCTEFEEKDIITNYYKDMYEECFKDQYIVDQLASKAVIYDYLTSGLKKLQGIIEL